MLRTSGAMIKLAGAIDVVVRPHRGLDLGAASFAGQPFAWLTPLGEDAPTVAGDWWASWGGGLMTTAGLDNVGEPADGLPLHGTYNYLPAQSVEVDGNRISGTVADARGVVVHRQIVNDPDRGHLRLVDSDVEHERRAAARAAALPLQPSLGRRRHRLRVGRAPRRRVGGRGLADPGNRRRTGLRAPRRAALARPDRRADRRDPVEPAPPLAVGPPERGVLGIEPANCSVQGPRVRRLRREAADPAARRGARDVARHHRREGPVVTFGLPDGAGRRMTPPDACWHYPCRVAAQAATSLTAPSSRRDIDATTSIPPLIAVRRSRRGGVVARPTVDSCAGKAQAAG